MEFKLTDSVSWVGKIDWELRHFHGDELSTHRGTSYNSFLIRDEQVVLIDTVWGPFKKEYVDNLKQQIDLSEIDYIISLHGEPDHSGALVELMREIPNTPIYCSEKGVTSLSKQYHKEWDLRPVKTGDSLDLGKRKLTFVEAKMLHWPDTMFAFLSQDNILFSSDAFGQHYASSMMYNDLVDESELYEEALKYYANILTPFNKMVTKKIEELTSMDLPIDMICPSHGIIWRDRPLQIVEKYQEWANDYQEHQITIIYDTMWESTRQLAEAINKGLKEEDELLEVKLFNLANSDKNDVITEIFKSKGLVVGSPTINRGMLHSVRGILEMIKGASFKNKVGAVFGCYGWSGESPKIITEELEEAKFKLVPSSLKVFWSPGEPDVLKAKEFAGEILNNLRN